MRMPTHAAPDSIHWLLRPTARTALLALLLSVAAVFFSALRPLHAQSPTDPIVIPEGAKTPTLDGSCRTVTGAPEYDDGLALTYSDVFSATRSLYLKQTATDLWACVEALPGELKSRFGALYVDTDNGQEAESEADDLQFAVAFDNAFKYAARGDSAGGYTVDATIAGWDAKATNTPNGETFEWRIPLGLLSAVCDAPFGLAAYHMDVRFAGDNYGWPSGQFYNVPSTWQSVDLAAPDCPPSGKIAYLFRSDDVTANDFKALLEANGFTVQLVTLAAAGATDFSAFDAVLVADDTGDLSEWPHGVAGASPLADHVRAGGKPVIGLGEGGYAWLGKHGSSLGWPNGWHGPLHKVIGVNPGMSYWQTPTDFTPLPAAPIQLYTAPVNTVSIYHLPLGDVVPLGVEPDATDHAPLIVEKSNCYQLWGFAGGPGAMVASGKDLFINAVVYALAQDCTLPEPPPLECVQLQKVAVPPSGAAVAIGSVIEYKLTLKINADARCATARAELEDPIPDDTLFVPGSAGPGVAPGVDGVLRWSLGPLAAGATVSRSFKVTVVDAICNDQRRVNNQARIVTVHGVVLSNLVTHPVDCPPVIPAGTQPPYAEDEIEIYPYPMITGQSTDLSVRVRNISTETITVRVTFEGSPSVFGIGIPFATLPGTGNARTFTLSPAGSVDSVVEVHMGYVPVVSGHYCIRVKIELIPAPSQRPYPPIYTYRNLDVMENLRPGVSDTLTFTVGNPTAATADVRLVVDNTCPGWLATVNPALLPAMAPGETRNATLTVTPPTDRPLGTACHIDVQGWIGETLIGGIRKLDVPPVHLPRANPPWEEREIVLLPDPPVVGQPGQICVQLQNPMPFPRTVAIDFAEADFGAGIGFTPIGSLPSVVLPPNSFAQYCIPWTPTAGPGATLHRCILVTLRQAGFRDQISQRNIDIRRISLPTFDAIFAIKVPFRVGNPAGFQQALQLHGILIGLNPALVIPRFFPEPPPTLGPGQFFSGELQFVPGPALAGAADAAALDSALADGPPFLEGDSFGAEVEMLLNGEPAGGFSVQFDAPSKRTLLPLVAKQ